MNMGIIELIKERVAQPAVPRDFPPIPLQVFPPASEESLSKAESQLGFRIAPLLRQIYGSVGNGGFGPGYGIIGVEGGHAPGWGTLVEVYGEIRRGADYLGLEWKPSVLPFCEWGCNRFSCVDCEDDRCPVILSETCETYLQNYTLEEFFRKWLDDVDIMGASRTSRPRTVVGINPFTGKATKFTSHRRGRKTKGQ